MKNLDAYTFGDQFFNDKPIEEDPGKTNMETEVESMATLSIYQASSSVPSLSTPVIDLIPPKPISSTDLPYKIDQTVNEAIKEAVQVALQAPLKERFRDLSEADMKEILHDRMFESGSYRFQPEHVALYEALKAFMDRDNRDKFLEATAKSCKRRRDDQDPHIPPSDSDQCKKKRHDSDASASHQPQALMPSASKTTDTRNIGKSKLSKADLEGPAYKVVLNVSKPLPLGGPPGQVTIQPQFFFNKDLEYLMSGSKERRSALSISKLKAANYPDFGLDKLIPSLWIESEREYDISVAHGISHRWFKRKEFYLTMHSAPSDRRAIRSHMLILSVIRNIVIRKHVEDLQLGIKIYQMKLNLTELNWNASDFLYKEDYTIFSKPRAVIYRDSNDQKKMMMETEFKYNPGIETRIWSGDDRRRSKEFIEVIKARLKTRRIFRSLESFVSGRKHVEDLQLGIKIYQMKLNLTELNWNASDFLYKEDYTIFSKPRAVIYRDSNDQKKMMRETERRVKDLQLGVESYQKRLNLTKPDTYRSDLKRREAYTAYSYPRGFIYQNKDKKNRLMRIDELYKFSDGTLNDVRNALDDCLKGIRMQYFPTKIWRKGDKDRAVAMIQAIDKMLKTKRIMRSLERFVGGRQYEGDFRMLQRTI
nr:hypothetical protein [Tanacetum cinerariifolium]